MRDETIQFNPGPQILAHREKHDVSALRSWSYFVIFCVVASWTAGLFIGFIGALSIIMVLASLMAVLGIKHREVGLLGISMLCTLDTVSRTFIMTGEMLRSNTLNYWLMIVVLFNVPSLIGRRDIHYKLAAILGIIMLIMVPMSTDKVVGLEDTMRVLSLFGLIVYIDSSRKDYVMWYWVALVNGILAALGGALYYQQIDSLPTMNPNGFAYFPLTAFLVTCYVLPMLRKRGGNQIVLLLLAITNFVWVFLTASRGGIVTALSSGLIMLITTSQFTRKMLVIPLAFIGLLLISHFSNYEEHSLSRLDILLNANRSMDDRTSGRSDLVVIGLHMFAQHPLGVGTGGFAKTMYDIDRTKLGLKTVRWKESKGMNAHSGWVKILAENGLLGFLSLITFVGSFAVVGWKKRKQGFFVHGLIVTMLFLVALISTEYSAKVLWFLAAASIVLMHRQSASVEDESHLAVAGASEVEPVNKGYASANRSLNARIMPRKNRRLL